MATCRVYMGNFFFNAFFDDHQTVVKLISLRGTLPPSIKRYDSECYSRVWALAADAFGGFRWSSLSSANIHLTRGSDGRWLWWARNEESLLTPVRAPPSPANLPLHDDGGARSEPARNIF